MIYHVLVKPGSSKEEVVKTDDELIVRTRKKAHDGEANTAVIKLLSQYFDVPKTRIVIKSGAKSKHKTIEIV
ncbi:DUF167 domain-containing protein [Candidatus Saccharibacteria bacterium]|nr:DUF167 domain-containing protein [Candidatus Saccharibacteria bacterium]